LGSSAVLVITFLSYQLTIHGVLHYLSFRDLRCCID